MEDTSSCSDGTDSGHECKDHVPRVQGSPPLVSSAVPPCFDAHLTSDQSNPDSVDCDHCAPYQPASRITVCELIRTLTQPTNGVYPRGVSPKDLFDFICKLSEDQRISKSRNHLQVLLWRDVKLGKIQRLGTGVYTVPEFYDEISELKRLDMNGDQGHALHGAHNANHNHSRSSKKHEKSKTGTVPAPIYNSSLTNGHKDYATNSMTSQSFINHESRDSNRVGGKATVKQEYPDPGDFSPKLTIHIDDPPPGPHPTADGALDLSSSRISLKMTLKTPNKRKRNHPLQHNSNVELFEGADPDQKSYAIDLSPPTENGPHNETTLPENVTANSYCSNMPILVNEHGGSGVDPLHNISPYSKHCAEFSSNGQLSVEGASGHHSDVSPTNGERKRSGDLSSKKKKRIKKEADDSDSKNSSSSFTSTGFQLRMSTPDAVCFFCQMTSVESIIGHPEKLLTCFNCRVNAHPTCMGYTASLAERCRSYHWQCSECKICSYCSSADKPESLLLCDDCDRGYHMHCHEPPILEKPLGRWSCTECSAEAARKCLENGGGNIFHGQKPKKSKNVSSRNVLETAKRNILIQNTVESIGCTDNNNNLHQDFSNSSGDHHSNAQTNRAAHYESQLIKKAASEANNWTVDQVYTFICQLGFPEQAVAFRREEIDGQALLLLKRNDVLSMLSLKLGPALKIHRRLSILQSIVLGTGEPDPDT